MKPRHRDAVDAASRESREPVAVVCRDAVRIGSNLDQRPPTSSSDGAVVHTQGAASFVDFMVSFMVGLSITMIDRLYLGPAVDAGEELQGSFNFWFIVVREKCCSLYAVEGIPRRSWPSLGRRHRCRDSETALTRREVVNASRRWRGALDDAKTTCFTR